MGIVIAWTSFTLVSAVASAVLARRAGGDGLLFALMAVLLGPGAVPLTRAACQDPEDARLGPSLAMVGLLNGFLTTLLVLSNTTLPNCVASFEGMSLALPRPTQVVCLVVNALQYWPALLAMLAVQWYVPVRLFARLKPMSKTEVRAADILEAWSALLPPFAFISLLFSGLALGLLCPLLWLVGYVGG